MPCPVCKKCGCQCGKLPYTMTVGFSGLQNKTRGNYCDLSFASNFGSGAAGVAMSAGGCNGSTDPLCGKITKNQDGKCGSTPTYGLSDRGPIAGVLLTEPGSCYARLGRVAPTLTASASPGTGANFNVSLAQKKDSGGFDYWEISSISATGGKGYIADSPVVVSHSVGDTIEAAPSITLKATRLEPTITASARGGSGASLKVSLEQNGGTPETWRVASVSVAAGGAGYKQDDSVMFSLGENVVALQSASATINVADGAVSSVSLSSGGQYYRAGAANGVNISSPGKYYREDSKASPYVANVKVTPCGGGTGAAISATVDSKVGSETFGQLTGLKIDNGGSNYLSWGWINTCRSQLNDKSFVLRATTPEELVGIRIESNFGSGACARVANDGRREQPCVRITGSGNGGSITPTLSKQNEDGDSGRPYWTIQSISASGGSGYPNTGAATVSLEYGSKISVAPAVTLSASGGSLTGATVNNGGKFYIQYEYDGTPSPIRNVEVVSPGSGYALIGRSQPTLTLAASSEYTGSGVSLTPTWEKHTGTDGLDYWSIASVAVSGGTCYGNFYDERVNLSVSTKNGTGASFDVDNSGGGYDACFWRYTSIDAIYGEGGEGYVDGEELIITPEQGAVVKTPARAVLQVDENGSVVDVQVTNAGYYQFPQAGDVPIEVQGPWEDDFPNRAIMPASLTLNVNSEGVPTGVTVHDAGAYYKEDPTKPPLVAKVTATVEQIAGSNGSGAQLSVVVQQDPFQENFGGIESIKVVNSGSGYTFYGGPKDCSYYGPCGIGLKFRGTNKEPEVTLGDAVYRAADKVTDCNTLPSTATLLHSAGEGSVSLSAGGLWNSLAECPCLPNGCAAPGSKKCGDATPCCPCKGECDGCNACASSCDCVNGQCVPSCACATCDEQHPCGEGCYCCNGQCVRNDTCCGSCDQTKPCPPGCYCCDGACIKNGECCGWCYKAVLYVVHYGIKDEVCTIQYPSTVGDWVLAGCAEDASGTSLPSDGTCGPCSYDDGARVIAGVGLRPMAVKHAKYTKIIAGGNGTPPPQLGHPYWTGNLGFGAFNGSAWPYGGGAVVPGYLYLLQFFSGLQWENIAQCDNGCACVNKKCANPLP